MALILAHSHHNIEHTFFTYNHTVLPHVLTHVYHLLERWRNYFRFIIQINLHNVTFSQHHLLLNHPHDLCISPSKSIGLLPNLALLLQIQKLIKCAWLAKNAPPLLQLRNQFQKLFLDLMVLIGDCGHFTQLRGTIGGGLIAQSIKSSKSSISVILCSQDRVQGLVPLIGNIFVTKALLEVCSALVFVTVGWEKSNAPSGLVVKYSTTSPWLIG